MQALLLHIAIFSNNSDKLLKLKILLDHQDRRVRTYKFNEINTDTLQSEIYDLLIFDGASESDLDYAVLEEMRSVSGYSSIPVLFLLSREQNKLKLKLTADNTCLYLVEPYEDIDLLNSVKILENMGQFEKKYSVYKEILDSEKQLLNHLDELLQLQMFENAENEDQFKNEIYFNFLERLELTFA